MSKTLGRWEQQTPFTDAQLFLAPNADFSAPATSAQPVLTSAGAGLLTLNMAASATYNLFSSISQLFRTGQLATAAVNQEQYGTAAGVPGPSSVANTSDPLNLPPGFPPWLNSTNPALTGGQKGPIPKGLQVNWIDMLYEIDTLAATSVTAGLTLTKFPAVSAPAAPVVSNLLALGANGLGTGVNTAGQSSRYRMTPTIIQFNFADASEMILNVNFVLPATSTAKFYGAILGITFNYN